MTSPSPRDAPRPPFTGFLAFMDGVLADNDKTRNLSHLIRQISFWPTVSVALLLAMIYITMSKAPIVSEVLITCGFIAFISIGAIGIQWLRRRSSKRRTIEGSANRRKLRNINESGATGGADSP
jgi:hypothetical protein